MDGIPVTRVSWMIQVASVLENAGTSPERLTRRLNMPMWHHCPPDAFMPLQHLLAVMDAGSRIAGKEAFGASVADNAFSDNKGFVYKATIGAPTICAAIIRFVNIVPSIGAVKPYWIAGDRDHIWICRSGRPSFDIGEKQAIQYGLSVIVWIVRQGAGKSWRPPLIKLEATDTLGLEQTEMFGECEIQPCQQLSAVAIPRSVLALPMRDYASHLSQPTVTAGDDARRTQPADDFVGSLTHVIETLLVEGQPKIEVVAEIVGLNVRTLQRKLRDHDRSYRNLIDEARFRAAARFLRRTNAPITDLAYELGYANNTHFTRAFRRWAGVSPSEFRRLS